MGSSLQVDAAQRRTLIFCLAAVWMIWGGSYVVTRVGVHHLPPFLFGGLRFSCAGVILLVVSRLLGNRPRFTAQECRNVAWVGVCSIIISNGANVWSLQWMASNRSALLNATGVLWIVALSSFGRRAQPLDRITVMALAAGFVGTFLVIGGGDRTAVPTASLRWWPEIITMLGVLGWAVATVHLRKQQSQLDILSFTGAQMLLGGIGLTLIGISLGELQRWNWSPQGLAALSYMLIMSSLIGYTAYAWLAKHASPAWVGSYSYVTPALAALLGWWILDERLTASQLLGMAIMLISVAIAGWPRAQRPSRTSANEGHDA